MSSFPFRGPRPKHRKTRCFLTPWAEYTVNYKGSGDPEVTPRWAPWGRRQGRHATITFGYQPKASGKGTGWPSWPAPGFKGYRPCRRPLSWTSVLERCTSVFATLHKRFGTLHKRVCNAEQATYKVGLANTEGATHKWSHMVSCRPNTL